MYYVTLFYIIFLIFLVSVLRVKVMVNICEWKSFVGFWDLCIELFLAVRSFVESFTNNFVRILCKLALFNAIFNCIIRSILVNNWRFEKNQNTCLEINVILSWKHNYFDRRFMMTSKVNMIVHSFSLRIY